MHCEALLKMGKTLTPGYTNQESPFCFLSSIGTLSLSQLCKMLFASAWRPLSTLFRLFMNILAFDTSTENLSIALSVNGQRYSSDSEGGVKASRTLLAQVHRLLQQAQLQISDLNLIVFGSGPGSFTGLRTACAAAQGLAYAHQIKVLPVSCLLATAQQAFNATQHTLIQVVLDARMFEVYTGLYQYQTDTQVWNCLQEARTVAPEQLVPVPNALLAGNAFREYSTRWQSSDSHFDAYPHALALLDVVPNLLSQGLELPAHLATPHYVRDKVALSTAERLANASQLGST